MEHDTNMPVIEGDSVILPHDLHHFPEAKKYYRNRHIFRGL